MAENHKIENSGEIAFQQMSPSKNQQSATPKEQTNHEQQQPPPSSPQKSPGPQQHQMMFVRQPHLQVDGPERAGSEPPLALQPPPPPRNKAHPLQVPSGTSPHPRMRQRRASDVIDSGSSSPFGSPGSNLQQGSLPRELRDFVPRSPLPSPLSPRSPASDRGYGGSTFCSPVSPARDATDAGLANTGPSEDIQPPLAGYIEVPVAAMPVEKDAEEYNMKHKRRGRAVIFDNNEFQMVGMAPRLGSEVDVKNLTDTFKALQFEVMVHTNKTYAQIIDIINQLAEEDHTDADCIAIAVLTHGLSSGFLLAQDIPYQVNLLWQPFTPDKCRTLAGKPKLFFIQACRGDRLDTGVTLQNRIRTETDSGRGSYKIPSHSDFLLAHSSSEGYYSWRNTENGTWFIQCLCAELNANGKSMDLLRVLTRVSRRVALDFESFNDINPWENQCKQVPSFTSMLIRDLIFHPKV